MENENKFKSWMNKDGSFKSASDYVSYLKAIGNIVNNNIFNTTDIIKLREYEKKLFASKAISEKTKTNYNSGLRKYIEYTKTTRSEIHNSNFNAVFNYEFTSEHFGKSQTESKTSTINRTHGIIVNSLEKVLKEFGYKTGNDRNIDLFIHKNDQIEKMFEVKTTSSTQSLYSAVGQLLIYSIPIKNNVALILVLPDKLKEIVEKRLSELGLKILYYDIKNNEPTFKNLAEIL
ncbi:MAG: hypothetical protein ABI388_05895 [Bacteroidia bacterium]